MRQYLPARCPTRTTVIDVYIAPLFVDKRLVDQAIAVVVDAIAYLALGRRRIAIPIIYFVLVFRTYPAPDASTDITNRIRRPDFVSLRIDYDIGIGRIDESIAVVVYAIAHFRLRHPRIACTPVVTRLRLDAIFPTLTRPVFVRIATRYSKALFALATFARIVERAALHKRRIATIDRFARIPLRASIDATILPANHPFDRFQTQITRRVAMPIDRTRRAKARCRLLHAYAPRTRFYTAPRPRLAFFVFRIGAILVRFARLRANSTIVGAQRQTQTLDAFPMCNTCLAIFALGNYPFRLVFFDTSAIMAHITFATIVPRHAFACTIVLARRIARYPRYGCQTQY